MAAWTREELTTFGDTLEVELAVRRADGTLRKPLPVWVVRAGAGLYVRSWRGRDGAWYRTAQESHAGRIRAGSVEQEITFVDEPDPGVNDQIDHAYRAKYGHSSYVSPMISANARETTLKLVPRRKP